MPLPGSRGRMFGEPREALRLVGERDHVEAERLARRAAHGSPRRPSPSCSTTSATTRSLAVAVVAEHRHAGGPAVAGSDRCDGSPAGSRGPSRRCSGPRRRRTGRWPRMLGSTSPREALVREPLRRDEQHVDRVRRESFLGSSSQSSELSVLMRRGADPSRSAIAIWLRISESSGLIDQGRPVTLVAPDSGRDPVDEALAPARPLDDQSVARRRARRLRWRRADRRGRCAPGPSIVSRWSLEKVVRVDGASLTDGGRQRIERAASSSAARTQTFFIPWQSWRLWIRRSRQRRAGWRSGP